ncbi:hypothetical protein J2793_007080 [Paraburkholderia caledonica]|uniref:Uncharacterized protein n=1 Tax=Paraburkholderia caledonica TaxID=134536 RepID=A0AB73INU8_9BURK|nr:hypothetical protein [Paraburkholderia caledonica]
MLLASGDHCQTLKMDRLRSLRRHLVHNATKATKELSAIPKLPAMFSGEAALHASAPP